MGFGSNWLTGWQGRGPLKARRPADGVLGRVETLERRTLLSTTLSALADADVQNLASDPNTANANFGADELLRVRRVEGETLETFVTFDLRDLDEVAHAILKMTGGQTGTPGEAVLVGAFPAAGGFVEGNGTHGGTLDIGNDPAGEIRFNNRPGGAGGAIFTSIVTNQGDYYWNVTDYVRGEHAAGKEFVTLGLRYTSGGAAQVAFGSREGSGGDAPKLIVEEDGGGPLAGFFAPDITGPTPDQQVVITYSDTDGIDAGTIDVNDITVRAPGGPELEVRGVTVQQADANSIVATYTVTGPGGAWDAADNQAYTTLLDDGGVKDLNGNPATGGPDVFTVTIGDDPPPADDTQAPAAALTGAPADVTTAGGGGTTVEVTFTDNLGLVTSGLLPDSLLVTKRGGDGTPLTINDVALDPAAGVGTSAVALFSVVAPGGSWDEADNGVYDVRLPAGAVTDIALNDSNEVTASFNVAIGSTGEPLPPGGDTTGPVATVVPLDPLIEAGGVERLIRVTYVDDVAVNLASIDAGDVVITGGPVGSPPLSVTDVSVSPPAGGASVTATYTVAAPGGTWDNADNGIYTVAVAAGAAADTSSNLSAAASANFEVNIPAPEPAVDPSFGGGGPVSTGFVVEGVAAQPDGKIVLAGRQGDLAAGTSQLVLQRLNPDGTPDATFGTGGRVLGTQGANEAAFAVAVTADGSILVAGRRDGDMMVTRFKPNGTVDGKFGTGGIATADFNGEDTAYSLAVAADGSLVIAGGSLQPPELAGGVATDAFAFARFLKDGRPDPFFGNAGQSLFAQGDGGNVAGSIAIDESGRVVAAGPSEGGMVAVVRLNANGTEDTSFGANGVLVVDQLATLSGLDRPDRSIGIVAQPGGGVLVSNRSPGGDFGIARILPNGTLDPSFSGDGVMTVDFGGEDDADQLLVQGSGEIFALGTTTAGGNQLAVAAIAPDGTLITSFGEGGKFTVEATPTETGRELRIGDLVLRAFGSLQGGRLVLGGSDQRPAAVTSSPLRRLNTPGASLLGTFGGASAANRKGNRLSFMDTDGTVVTMSIKGPGTGQAFADSGAVDVVLSGVTDGTALVVKARGGADGRFAVRNIQSDGGLKSVNGKTTDVSGTFSVNGGIGKAALGALTGTLAVAGPITQLLLSGDVTGRVLSGANFGTDGDSGGTGSAADAFGQGSIGKLTVAGKMVGAMIAAGVDPMDGQFLNEDDRLVGGAASAIGRVTVKRGADASTRFGAGAFAPKVKLPVRVNPLEDARFMLLQ